MSEIMVENKTNEPDYIRLTYKGEEVYTLQFSRASALFAQDKGFSVGDIDTKPGRVIPDLFFFAMRKNHSAMPREKVDKLREKLFPNGIPMKVVQRLGELYEEACLVQVIDLDNEEEPKNADTIVEM